MKRFAVLSFVLLVLLGVTSSLEGASAEPKRGGTITLSISKELASMNPLVNTSSTEARIRELMFEPLLAVDLKGAIVPRLAEAWEVANNGRLYIFRLRKGVKFHNGKEVTAEDVKFAMDYTMNAKNGAYGFEDLNAVERVEVADKYTLRVHVKRHHPLFLTMLTEIRAFSVIPKESLPEGLRKPPTFPAGTGPFKFVEWQPGQRIVFERFGDYWGHKALVDRVVMREIGDATVRFTALRAGDVDIIERTPYEWVQQIVQGKIRGIGFAKAARAGARNLEFNVADPPFNNKKLRLAVAHALDKKEILQAAYFGLADPSDQRFPEGHVWHFDVPSPQFDPNKARAFLKEAGYKGETIELMGNRGEVADIEGAAIQAQLRRIGIKVELKILERASALEARRQGKYMFKLAGGSDYPDPLPAYQEYLCEPDPRKRRLNESGYCDKEYDALMRKAEAELDPAKRRVLFRQVVAKLTDDVPIFPIGFTPRFFTFRDYVKGFVTNSSGDFQVWGGGLSHTWLDR
ncbi:MAG: ABC transporter substrate-binding protein [Candidatus Binatia bacterium]